MNKNIHTVVLLAFIFSIFAPACGFAWNGKYSVIDICTTQGIESKVVLNTSEHQEPSTKSSEKCQFCANSQNIDKTATPDLKISLSKSRETKKYYLNPSLLISYNTDYYQPRAPPSLI